MKTSAIAIALLIIGWFLTVAGDSVNNMNMMLCALPILFLGVLLYFYKAPPAKARKPVSTARKADEQFLPQWVVNARCKMKQNAQQNYNWRDDSQK